MSKDQATESRSSRDEKLDKPQTAEERVEAMYQRMQEPGFGEAMLQAFNSKPCVSIEPPPTNRP